MKEIVDEFNATVGKDKGIWVDYVSMSQIDRKTLISTAAGVPPDIAGLWDTQVLEFASMNALEPLDSYAGEAGMTRDHYKHVFYDGCLYQGKLYAIPSTVWCVALLWNKEVFAQRAAQLRAAGLDPDRAPRTIDELDRYAAAIDTWDTRTDPHRLLVAGYIPLVPGSFTNVSTYWFGGDIVDATGTRLMLRSPAMHETYGWIRGYTRRMGKDALAEFQSSFNAGSTALFDTPQNPFLMGWISMEQQGPWMAAFVEKLKPSMMRWHVPPDQLQRERDFDDVALGMTLEEVKKLLGRGDAQVNGSNEYHWLGGIKDLYVSFADGKVASKRWEYLPAVQRQKYCQWGAAPFPSAVAGLNNVTYAGMDVWVVPSTSKHKKEAFEFIKYASQQAQIERLSSEHCNLSPLAQESTEYLQTHPNPYVDVYEALAASPNARSLPPLINWPQVFDELEQVAEQSALLEGTTDQILDATQVRVQKELNKARDVSENFNVYGDAVKSN